jgi:signal transduction histidine kinase
MPAGPFASPPPEGGPRLSDQLRRRLLPATFAVALVISIGFPAVFVALEIGALRRSAGLYAERIALRIEDVVVEAPALWPSQTSRYAAILHGLPRTEPVRRITLFDDSGRPIAEYVPPGDHASIWERSRTSAFAPVHFEGRAIGTVEIGVSYGRVLLNTLVLLGVSTALGVGLAFLLYRHPTAIARSLEGRMYDLVEETRRANSELTRVLGETRRERQAATALEQVARDLTSSLQWDRVLERIVDRAREVCDADVAVFAPYDVERARATVAAVSGARTPGIAGLTIFPGRGAAGKVLETGRSFATADYLADARISPDYRSSISAEGLVSLAVVPVKFDDAITGLLWVARRERRPFGDGDIAMLSRLSDQAAIAQKNAALYRDAQRALTELKVAQEQLVRGERLCAVGEMASGMAHHLNNVLAVVLGHAQLLLGKVDDSALRRGLTVIERATLDGAEVVRRVQRFTQADTRGDDTELDVNELVTEAVELTRFRWHDEPAVHGARIEMRVDRGDVPRITGVVAALREALVNLLINAIEAVAGGGAITVRTSSAGEDVWISVTDTGPGIDEDVRRRAFEPFFTTKGPQRTGLGLSVAYGTVIRHGGDLTLDNAPSGGTVAVVRLRRRAAATARGMDPPQSARPLRVLVVDDDADVREIAQDLLRSMGHETVWAADGRAALAVLETRDDVDLVLTDLGMSEMSGWDLARAIKARWPALPVAMMTGWGEAPPGGESEHGLLSFVVPKPMLAAGLVQRLGVVVPSPGRA